MDQRFHERMVARGYAVADVGYRLALEATCPARQADIRMHQPCGRAGLWFATP